MKTRTHFESLHGVQAKADDGKDQGVKMIFRIVFFIGVSLSLLGALSLNDAHALDRQGIGLEIEVVPKASLSISSAKQASPNAGTLRFDLGEVDAFGIHRPAGVLVEVSEAGAAYYQSFRVNAGVTGGSAHRRNLLVSLVRADPPMGLFFEAAGDRLDPGQVPPSMVLGQKKTIISNLSGFRSTNRVLGIMVRPETALGSFSAQVLYSLESGE